MGLHSIAVAIRNVRNAEEVGRLAQLKNVYFFHHFTELPWTKLCERFLVCIQSAHQLRMHSIASSKYLLPDKYQNLAHCCIWPYLHAPSSKSPCTCTELLSLRTGRNRRAKFARGIRPLGGACKEGGQKFINLRMSSKEWEWKTDVYLYSLQRINLKYLM